MGPTSPGKIFKRPSTEVCSYVTLSIKVTHRSKQGFHSAAAALSLLARTAARRTVGCAAGKRWPDPVLQWHRPSAPRAASAEPAANPPPLPPALKDVELFLPRTKDNKGSRGATHQVEARPQAPSACSSSPCPGRVARRSLPLTARAASRARAPPAPPLPQRSHGRRGPGLPGRLCREPLHSHAAALPQPRPPRYPGALPDARVLLPAQRRALGPRRAA